MEAIFNWIVQYGYVALFTLLMLGIIGLPVPDETLLTFAGSLVFKNKLALLPTIATAFLGSICGISMSYGLGRSLGTYLVSRIGHLLHIDQHKMDHVRAWYDRNGKYALVFGYFVPGFRHLLALVAGSSRLPLTIFAPFAYTGGLLWTISFVTLGYFLGEEWARMSPTIHRLSVSVSLVAFSCIAIIFLISRRRRSSK